jgi:CRP-like cAMP-binding protein
MTTLQLVKLSSGS